MDDNLAAVDVAQLREEAETGSVVAQGVLGMTLLLGDEGVEPNHEQAFRWLSKAAADRVPRASVWLGRMYEDGLAVTTDLARAEELYRFGAGQGEVWGCLFLGRLLASGKLGSVDETAALRWYETALQLCPVDDSTEDDPDLLEARNYVRDRKGPGALPRSLFGSYDRLLGTAVHANGWWLREAGHVELEGTPDWHDLTGAVAEAAAIARRTVPSCVDGHWYRRHAPIALQLRPASASPVDDSPLCLDFLAGRLEHGGEVTFPFLLREHDNSVRCGFSDAGPDPALKRDIVLAVASRFVQAERALEWSGGGSPGRSR